MNKKSMGNRTLHVVAGLALGAFAAAAHASPYTLQGNCVVSSILAAQGQCQIVYQLNEAGQVPTSVRKALVRVNGKVVNQYVNDSSNPSPFLTVFGTVTVACGTSHVVTALVAPVGGTYAAAGDLLPVLCPTVQ